MINFILLAIAGIIMFLAMRKILSLAEHTLTYILNASLPSPDTLDSVIPCMPGYTPVGSPVGSPVGTTQPPPPPPPPHTTTTPTADSYRSGMVDYLASTWPDVKRQTLSDATADFNVLSNTTADADSWAPIIAAAVANDLATTTGLPIHIATDMVKTTDITNASTLDDIENRINNAAAAYANTRGDGIPDTSFVRIAQLLASRGRPLALLKNYYTATTRYLGTSTDIAKISTYLMNARHDNTLWIPLTTRAGDN